MWAAQAAVLGKADTAVRNKLSRFDLADRSLHKAPELLTLLFRDRRSQILNFGSMFPHEDDQGYFRNPADPRITDELRIERKQSLGLGRITTGCRLPVDQAVLAIDLPEGIQIGNEFASSRQCPKHFDLQILLRAANPNAIIPRKGFEQMDPLVEEVVPGLSFAVLKRSIAVCFPFLEKNSSAILLTKVGTQSFFKAATEDHRCPGLFFPPAIQIPVAVAAWAAKILANLRVAIDHRCLPAHRCGPVMCIPAPPSPPRGQRHRGFGNSVRSESYERSGRPREDSRALFQNLDAFAPEADWEALECTSLAH